MNKLQLYITTSQAEFQTRVEINSDSYVQSWVSDLRDAVSQVDYPTNEKSIFYLIKYINTGVFIVVLRTIPKEAGYHLAAWIYIPYTLRISDRDVADVVEFIAHKVDGSEVTPKDIAEMREVFSHEYEEDVMAPIFPPSEGLAYAYRYYGARTGTTLQQLIGPFRYQPCYLRFAGVLLVNQEVINDVGGTNLTSAPIDDMAVLLPPTNAVVDGYRPTLYGFDFDMPYYVPMSRNIDIVWCKENAADIKQSIYVSQSEMRAPVLNVSRPAPLPHKPRHADKPTAPASNAAPSSVVGASSQSSDVPTDRKKTYRFQIPAKSASIGTVIEFEITTNANLEGSPIDGYEATSDIQEGAGRSNHLLYVSENPKKGWITNGLFALCGFLAGIGVGLLATCSRTEAPVQQQTEIVKVESAVSVPTEAPVETNPAADVKGAEPIETSNGAAQEAAAPAASAASPAASAPQPSGVDRSLDAAIKYLDTNQIWDKEEMEAFPDLKGLYDDMNNIERHKLVEYWGPKLRESRAFTTQIVHHSKLSYKKKARRTPFNDGAATKIRVQAYLNTIDP